MGKTFGTSMLAALAGLTLATAMPAQASPAFMATGALTTQPVGHYELCQRLPAECAQETAGARPVELTRELWATLIEINNTVNTRVAPLTDFEIWGREEVWSYPTTVGDCEDYVLEKRRLLMEAGLPAGNLLITVVRQPDGSGHAVLTVNTSYGDFVLDNLEPRVMAWNDTEYRYLKRQSQRHSGAWVAIENGQPTAVGSVSR
ncbi:transglutaminase-like cysteine peptidase [Aquibium sp. A9E412]|uniref:transglutaminase-like cysteine peptidase n=1 Tax=Aquibium sp. A9E412 TaxID=2976767 RepID=UPI0025B03FD2|nr:transglutaminase-like cysteine peptidase [Aquibium sp. A9E412]MDN2568163.1 transglutaminase-like cysteine peptidase [Aquibium sp. A9E412]